MANNRGNGVKNVGNNCILCGKLLTKRQQSSRQKFCSHYCYSLNKIGQSHSWGSKISKALTGKPKTKSHIENSRQALIGRKRPEMTGEKHFAWKGDDVGYDALHDWVRRQKGIPKKCEHCGKKQSMKNGRTCIHWANKSKKYKRHISDWIGLCRKCHYKYDKK